MSRKFLWMIGAGRDIFWLGEARIGGGIFWVGGGKWRYVLGR